MTTATAPTAEAKLIAHVASYPTGMLIEIAHKLNLSTEDAEMIVAEVVLGELQRRMDQDAFCELAAKLEAELIAA